MDFEKYWKELNKKKKIDGNVKLTPVQFKKMLSQAFEVGRRHGVGQTRAAKEFLDNMKDAAGGSNNSNDYYGDMLKDIFGQGFDPSFLDKRKDFFS
jgi:hypothetical protein